MKDTSRKNIFISVGTPATPEQEDFITEVENRLQNEGYIPNTVGRNAFSVDSPLKAINDLMDNCCGAVIIALERTYFPEGLDKRGPKKLNEIKYPTPWNQIESAMAYTKRLPMLFIVEEDIKPEGLLDKGFDWYILLIKPIKDSLYSAEFNKVLSSWKQKVDNYNSTENRIDLTNLTIGELIKSLKISHLWGILAALMSLLVGAFALGQYLHY
jgi:hypothetical protein